MKTIIEEECNIRNCKCPDYDGNHLHTIKRGRDGERGPPGYWNGPVDESRLLDANAKIEIIVNGNCNCYQVRGNHIHVVTHGPRGVHGPRGFPGSMDKKAVETYVEKKEENPRVFMAIANCRWCDLYKNFGHHNHGVFCGERGARGSQGNKN